MILYDEKSKFLSINFHDGEWQTLRFQKLAVKLCDDPHPTPRTQNSKILPNLYSFIFMGPLQQIKSQIFPHLVFYFIFDSPCVDKSSFHTMYGVRQHFHGRCRLGSLSSIPSKQGCKSQISLATPRIKVKKYTASTLPKT